MHYPASAVGGPLWGKVGPVGSGRVERCLVGVTRRGITPLLSLCPALVVCLLVVSCGVWFCRGGEGWGVSPPCGLHEDHTMSIQF
ncbi:hypothetical protein FKM82_023788 [Ascaphus truei]